VNGSSIANAVFEAYFFAFCSFGVNGFVSLDESNASGSPFGKLQKIAALAAPRRLQR
jgi:hypothetical protein